MAVAHALIAECCVLLYLRGQMICLSHRCELGLGLRTLGERTFDQKVACFFWPNREPWITSLILSAAWRSQALLSLTWHDTELQASVVSGAERPPFPAHSAHANPALWLLRRLCCSLSFPSASGELHLARS